MAVTMSIDNRGGTISKLTDRERMDLARSSETSIAELYYLAGDPNKYVRYYVADNPNTSLAALRILSKDKDYHVRCRVADNHNITSDLLVEMADDKNKFVREYVARNDKTPLGTLYHLTKDYEAGVSLAAQETINRVHKMMLRD